MIKSKSILNLIIAILLFGSIGFIIFKIFPDKLSEIELKKIENKFYTSLSRKDIQKIIIYVHDVNDFKIVLTDKITIQKIVDASKINYKQVDLRGGFGQHYMIRLLFKNSCYNFGYCKMDQYPTTECQKISLNKYRDCGRIFIYREADFKNDREPNGSIGSSLALLNVDLIPVLNQYIDRVIAENPKKYSIVY